MESELATPDAPAARRLAELPCRRALGIEIPVASTRRSRLLGLAWLDADRAGRGLLLPGCRSVHTFGMRFALDVVFLDAAGGELRWVQGVAPARFVAERRAHSTLELVPGAEDGGL